MKKIEHFMTLFLSTIFIILALISCDEQKNNYKNDHQCRIEGAIECGEGNLNVKETDGLNGKCRIECLDYSKYTN